MKTHLSLAYSVRNRWLVYTRSREKNQMEALWCFRLWHSRESEWFSPLGRLQEARPAGCCFFSVFDGRSCERTALLCSLTSVNVLCLFTSLGLICIKKDEIKEDQIHLMGQHTKQQVCCFVQLSNRETKRWKVSLLRMCCCFVRILWTLKQSSSRRW